MRLRHKNLLGIKDLTAEDINLILDTAESLKEVSTRDIKKVPTLRGRTVVTLFYEASTRTRTSFELAAKRLSADIISIATSISSVTKGETLKDTGKNIEAMNPDIIIIRHPHSGAPEILARSLRPAIVNAGDGAHEHPSQALLDLFTIREKKKRIAGLKVAIVGDITHSRVARSDIYALSKLGASVTLVGPATLIPVEIEKMGVKVSYRLEDVIPESDVIIMLRIQLERITQNLFPSIREYSRIFGLNSEKLKNAKKDLIVMHPGPINRGIELDPEVADGPHSVILEQVTNGIAVRMAVLYLLLGGKEESELTN
ncbi:MAG: aspartate carbamoyltransferase [Candidatus Schekmanbacteria bacterium RBG_16_38_11]|uniref:Aspartate carbamoyltransferase n=2 Tax=Candidatus Schekmaniibacteriota TaxID=1817811 RepID=A0A1F7RM88_9BACT|nr:MAG: aspartate carbamoyltransferase [Candidatus Schekmanbacteria bacterium GWA2_38_11]OGL45975.1 MAG: aspartate carbamoyltransferase [Candidatus Schekmanbacteria bacterium RBG_16_38_11]